MKNQLKAGAFLSYLVLFLNSAISIVYTPIMLNLLGQSEYGLYSLASSTIGYLGVLNFGLGNAVIRYTAKYKALGDQEACFNLYGMFCIIYGLLGFIALISGIILTLNSHIIFSNSLSLDEINKLKILMGISIINISVGIGLGVFSVIVLAHEKFVFQRLTGVISSILNPLIMLPLLLMGYRSITMTTVSTIINLITVLINMYYCFRVLRIKIKFRRVERDVLKEILVFSSFIFINLIIDKIYWSTDQIILGIYSGTIAISLYTVGSSFTGYFSGFSAAISGVFLSRVTGMVTKEASDKEISDLFIRVGRLQYIIISFAQCGFIVFGREFINLWVGENYHTSFIIALIILIPSFVSLIQGMGGVILQAKNRQKFKTIVYFVIAIVNVLISIIFVQWWGVVGCAAGTAVAFTIGNIIVMNIYYWKKIRIDIPKFWYNILIMSGPFFTCLLLGITVNKFVVADNWAIFTVKTIIFSIIYILLMWFTGMNKYERELFIVPLKNILHALRKRMLYKVG